MGAVRWRDAGRFLVMAGVLSVLASLWWIVPLLVHVALRDRLPAVHRAAAHDLGHRQRTENLRLMGYWTSYIGVGFGVTRPYFSDGLTMLFNPLVVGASLLLPALAIAGFVRARRWRYAPFLLLLIVVGVVIETAGFPNGTPIRGAMEWVYHHVFSCASCARRRRPRRWWRWASRGCWGSARTWRSSACALRRPRLRTAALMACRSRSPGCWCWRRCRSSAARRSTPSCSSKQIAPAWVAAGHGLDASCPRTRARGAAGPDLRLLQVGRDARRDPAAADRKPVAVRYETPYSDLHAVDLLTTVDKLVQQRRLLPGELKPLLGLMGVGRVVTGTDDDISRSGAIDPAAAAPELRQQLGSPSRAYGPRVEAAAGGRRRRVLRVAAPGAPLRPRARARDRARRPGRPGDDRRRRRAVAGGHGRVRRAPEHRPILYAGDMNATTARREAAAGANLVVGDSNRRREFVPQSTQQNLGATLGQSQPLATDSAVINPFPAAGANGQTVSVLQGARYLRAPSIPGELQFPENGAIAAFDGDTSTAWVADRLVAPSERWIEVGFNAPRDVPYVDVDPLCDSHGVVTEVDVNGVRTRSAAASPGSRSTCTTSAGCGSRSTTSTSRRSGSAVPAAFARSGFPGFHVRQLLRPPVLIGRDLAGTDLRHDSLSYVFERTTGDDPFRRNPYGTATVLNDPQDRGDAEAQIDRLVFAPAARSYSVQAGCTRRSPRPTRRLTAWPVTRGPSGSTRPRVSRTSPPTVRRARSRAGRARAGSACGRRPRRRIRGSRGPRRARCASQACG